MFADRVRMGRKKEGIEYIGEVYLARDDDFVKFSGRWVYRGSELEIEIPHIIQGEEVTGYDFMFHGTGGYLATPVTRVDSNNKGVTSLIYMFYDSKATTLDLSSFDTSNVTNMDSMFRNSSATTLDLSNFDTSNVTKMNSMFDSSSATTLDLSSFDTSKVTSMDSMFFGSSATTLDLSSFDTSNVTSMMGMFRNSSVTALDLSSFDTSKVTNMAYMFYDSKVTTLDLSSFDTSKVTNMSDMFRNSSATTGYARTQADADRFNNSSNKPTNLNFVVHPDLVGVVYVLATDDDFSGTANGSFKYVGTNEYIIMPNVIKGVTVTSYSMMFESNSVIKGVVSNNPNVTNMYGMFYDSSATTLDLSSFDTSNVTDMSYMFSDSSATTLDLSSFDTSKVTNMSNMFNSSSATTLDLTSFDTSNVIYTGAMFYGSPATTGYARTQADADRFNVSSNKPAGLVFVVKP